MRGAWSQRQARPWANRLYNASLGLMDHKDGTAVTAARIGRDARVCASLFPLTPIVPHDIPFDHQAFVPVQGKAFARSGSRGGCAFPLFCDRVDGIGCGAGDAPGRRGRDDEEGCGGESGCSVVMDRFLSNAVNRIDAKGRVSVPAHFRAVVQKRGYSELYALRCLDLPALDVGGLDLLDRYEQRIAQEDPFLQTADDMSFFCHGDGTFLKLDQDGRITMTDFIREHTGISTEVAFVGRGNFFQIWEPGRLAAYGAQARARLLQLRQGTKPGERPE